MRTTLTLDESLARRLRDRMVRHGESFKETVNSVLEMGLKVESGSGVGKFRVEAKALNLRAGFDPAAAHDLDTDLEVDRFLEVTRRLKQ